ncbi:MAG: P-II family nitrogen regulator [Leptospirales bacterium]
MKMIVAVIKPSRLDLVKEALLAEGVVGMTVTDVRGYGRQKGQVEQYRGSRVQIDFLPKIKVEVVVPESLLEKTLRLIQNAAQTGQIGDGKIFVMDLENVIRIRTGEEGRQAI